MTFRLRCVRGPAYTPSAMPIYEFVCMECESHFEELVGMNAADPACPDCGASRVARQLSVFAAHAAVGTAGQSAPAPRAGGGGGCCGGACGC
jgi:putative FmdB family regulatory protein